MALPRPVRTFLRHRRQRLVASVDANHRLRDLVGRVVEVRTATRALMAPPAPPDQRKFLIFSAGRSGSTLLVSLLASNPEVDCEGEVLRRRVGDPVRHVLHRARLSQAPVYGFKLLAYQVREIQLRPVDALLARLSGKGFALLYLRRDNHLRTVLSFMIARQRQLWHLRVGEEPSNEAVHLDLAELASLHERRRRRAAEERRLLQRFSHLSISYEDDLEDSTNHRATVDRIGGWLDLELPRADTNQAKLTPRDLRLLVSNYDEVREYARGQGCLDQLEP